MNKSNWVGASIKTPSTIFFSVFLSIKHPGIDKMQSSSLPQCDIVTSSLLLSRLLPNIWNHMIPAMMYAFLLATFCPDHLESLIMQCLSSLIFQSLTECKENLLCVMWEHHLSNLIGQWAEEEIGDRNSGREREILERVMCRKRFALHSGDTEAWNWEEVTVMWHSKNRINEIIQLWASWGKAQALT